MEQGGGKSGGDGAASHTLFLTRGRGGIWPPTMVLHRTRIIVRHMYAQKWVVVRIQLKCFRLSQFILLLIVNV